MQIFIAQYDCADHSWTTRSGSPLWINDGWWWRKLCHNMVGNTFWYDDTTICVHSAKYIEEKTLPCGDSYSYVCHTKQIVSARGGKIMPHCTGALLAWTENQPTRCGSDDPVFKNFCFLGSLNTIKLLWDLLKSFEPLMIAMESLVPTPVHEHEKLFQHPSNPQAGQVRAFFFILAGNHILRNSFINYAYFFIAFHRKLIWDRS